jgi:predicted PurR-regulated permease PerM
MKFALIFFLIGLVIVLGFNISTLRKELQNTIEDAEFMEERNNKLQRELMRLSRVNSENEQLLNELDQSLKEFNSKVPFATMKKYIPKRVWDDIKPIIDRLQVFQEARGKGLSQSNPQ